MKNARVAQKFDNFWHPAMKTCQVNRQRTVNIEMKTRIGKGLDQKKNGFMLIFWRRERVAQNRRVEWILRGAVDRLRPVIVGI